MDSRIFLHRTKEVVATQSERQAVYVPKIGDRWFPISLLTFYKK